MMIEGHLCAVSKNYYINVISTNGGSLKHKTKYFLFFKEDILWLANMMV